MRYVYRMQRTTLLEVADIDESVVHDLATVRVDQPNRRCRWLSRGICNLTYISEDIVAKHVVAVPMR
jgi:hypothetical protein